MIDGGSDKRLFCFFKKTCSCQDYILKEIYKILPCDRFPRLQHKIRVWQLPKGMENIVYVKSVIKES